MKNAKKAVRKAAVARKKAGAAKPQRVRRVVAKAESCEAPESAAALQEPKPLVLYKYARPVLEHVRQVVVERKLHFSDPKRFDDPFDCRVATDLGVVIVDAAMRAAEELTGENQDAIARLRKNAPALRARLAHITMDIPMSKVGVCCFTKDPESLPMWSHYAESHEGLCFEFSIPYWDAVSRWGVDGRIDFGLKSGITMNADRRSFPFHMVGPVSYEKIPSLVKWANPAEAGPADWMDKFFTKSKQWEHEQEWRAVVLNLAPVLREMKNTSTWQKRGLRAHRGAHSYSLGDNLVTKVILGARARAKFKRAVAGMARKAGIEVCEARPKGFEYGLTIEPYDPKRPIPKWGRAL